MRSDGACSGEAPLFIEEILGSLDAGNVVLDAGCGTGSFQHGKFPKLLVVSLDIKRPGAGARGDVGTKPLPPNFVLGDTEKLPIKTSSVDFVVMNYVFEHVSDADAAAAEASRALRQGGLLYAAVPNSRSFDDRFYRFAGYFAKYVLLKVHKRLEHQQRFDFVSFNGLLYEKGLRLLSFCECPSGYTWMNDPRISRFHVTFLKVLHLVKRVFGLDLFKGSNYLTLYERVGTSGVRYVRHVCAFCGVPLLRNGDRQPDPRACPHCGRLNVHW